MKQLNGILTTKFNQKNFITFLSLSFLTTLIIISAWFKSGDIITNSEESLTIVNPQKTVEMNITSWYPTEIGSRSVFGFTRAYPFLVLTFFDNIGFPAFLNQAILLGLIIFLTLVSSYILFNYLSQGSFSITFFASFFYLLNLYTQTQIFRRFLYNFMFALAFFPLFIYLWIKLLEERNFKYLFLFLLCSVLFSFSFNHPATILTFGFSAGLIALIKFWQNRKSLKVVMKLIATLIVATCLGVLVNIWWLYPLTSSSDDYLSSITNTREGDFLSLQAVSASFPISEILLLRQAWWYGDSQHWYEFYSHSVVYLISILALVLVIWGVKRSKLISNWTILVSLLLLGLIISKGSNPPFGNTIFKWLFDNFPMTAALRNPYEKFGIVFLLPYAFFFGVGLSVLIEKLKGPGKLLATSALCLLFFVVLVWPMWSGDVFLASERIKVPEDYKEANVFLNNQNSLRIFHLPMTTTFDQKYAWGFRGQDPSEYIFDRPSLSNNFIPPLNRLFYSKLPELAKNKDLPALLGFLSVGNIVVHHDAQNPRQDTLIEKEVIKNWDGITRSAQFGPLEVYDLDPSIVRSRFYMLYDLPKTQFPDSRILEDKFINVSFQRFSPVSYLVNINDSSSPFVLVFNDKFDSLWEASIDSQMIADHFAVYGLVNGWKIEKTGSFSVKVNLKQYPWD